MAPPAGNPDELDIPPVPALLRKRCDIRLSTLDRGATVLSEFSKAGVLPQIKLT